MFLELDRFSYTHRHTHTQTHTNIYIHTYIIGGQIFERSMIFLITHHPLCRGCRGVPHIPLMQNCPMIFLNTHRAPSGSRHLCDLHKASLAIIGTTRAAHVLTKAAATTSSFGTLGVSGHGTREGHNTSTLQKVKTSSALTCVQCQLCHLHSNARNIIR